LLLTAQALPQLYSISLSSNDLLLIPLSPSFFWNQAKAKQITELPDWLALTTVVSSRVLGQEMFDVQLRGALALARGSIAEMQTGEGKTLTAVPAIVDPSPPPSSTKRASRWSSRAAVTTTIPSRLRWIA
jgi:hypothetical protein